MTDTAKDRYKELKDWLKILSPLTAAMILSFKVGIVWTDVKAKVVKWDGYEEKIAAHQYRDSIKDIASDEKNRRIHAEIYGSIDTIRNQIILIATRRYFR
jgi:hypothetical protein